MSLVSLPFMLHHGMPDDARFYLFTALTAVIYSISDVVYFRAVPVIGSGMMTRLLPSSVVITFFAWFAFDPALLDVYLAQKWKSAAILCILALFVYFGMQVKKCSVSWQGVRHIWPVIMAACIGPIFAKLALGHATREQGVYAIMFFQSLMMVTCLGGFYAMKKPALNTRLVSGNAIRTSVAIGTVVSAVMFFKMSAIQLVDNPGYVSMVFFTDALWVLLIYRLIGKREKANIWAGLGIVFCAAMLVLVKTL